MQKSNKIQLFFFLFISYIPFNSPENQIVKLKVNQIGSLKLVNSNVNYLSNPDEILVNDEFIEGDSDTINIENIEDYIKLVWHNKLSNCKCMFSNLNYITEIDLTNFDSSEATDMQSMFNKCTSLIKLTLGNLNTEKVTSMASMFANCSSLVSLDLSGFQTSKVTEMDYMFYGCYSLKSLDLSNFNSSSNTYVMKMFMDCFSLEYLNLKGFKTDKIQNFNNMFNNCSSLKSLDISSFDTSFAHSSNYMFYGCSSLTSLNISNFNTDGIYDMDFMFAECKNLGYLNFNNLNGPGNSESFSNRNILDNTPQNLVICFTISKASKLNNIFSKKNCELLYCEDDWKTKQSKVNGETGICMDNCSGEFLYNYLNRCYRECPEGTKEKNIQFLCEDILIEVNDEIFDEEEKAEIEENEKIDESLETTLLRDYKYEEYFEKEKEIVDNYEIFESNELYFENEDETIKEIVEENYKVEVNKEEENFLELKIKDIYEIKEEENSDIDINNNNEVIEAEEKVDEIYKEEEIDKENYNTIKTIILAFNDTKAVTTIMDKSIDIKETSLNTGYVNNCDITSFFNNECKISPQISLEQKQNFVEEIITKIKDGSLESLITSVVKEDKNILIENEDEIYSIGTLDNQNINETKTLIDLCDCEKKLRSVYNITEEEKILIFKIEKYIPGYKIPILGYELFTQNGEINLNLDYCENIKTNTYISVDIDEKEVFKYDPNNEYYNDRCNQYTTENGTDITIYDRKNEYNENNMSLCEKNCEYKGYDINNKIVECECNKKNIKNFLEDKKQLLNEFKSVKKIMNLDLFKCYKTLFTFQGLKNNIGSYIMFSLFLITIICSIYFIIKGYTSLISQIKLLVKFDAKLKLKTKTNREKIKDDKEDKDNKNKSRNNLIQFQDENLINRNNDMLTLNNVNDNNIDNKDNKINKKKIKKKRKKKKELKDEKDINLNDYEMNSLDYDKALKYDNRSIFECYLSLIKTKQIIIFTFLIKNDYNSRIIKIILFLLSFSFNYATNALFFTDSTMHQIYVDHGIYDFLYQLPQIIYSTIISTLIDTVISYLSLTEESISELKQKKSKEKINGIKNLIKCIFIKFIFFFILNFLFLGFMWYYLSTFCAVYKNTQIFLLKDTLISYLTSLVYPFLYNFIPCIFRILALKGKSKDRNCLYKISQFLQIF